MMTYTEVVETVGKLRAVIELDECPEAPDGDYCSPVLITRRSHYGGHNVEVQDSATLGTYVLHDKVYWAAERFGAGSAEFARYVKAFHGAREVVTYQHSDGDVSATFDPLAWRMAMERSSRIEDTCSDEEILAKVHEDEVNHPEANRPSMDEWVAYWEGDVWGVRVEYDAGEDEWDEVDDTACWGYYGREYAEQTARDLLAAMVEQETADKIAHEAGEHEAARNVDCPTCQEVKAATADVTVTFTADQYGALKRLVAGIEGMGDRRELALLVRP